MKNLIKIFSIVAFIYVFIHILYANFISNQLMLSKDNSSFNTILTINNSGSTFQIKLTNIPSFGEVSRKYKTRLTSSPALNGLTFSGYTINGDTCNNVNINDNTNLEITGTGNNTFEYVYNPKGSPCEAIVTVDYTTAGITPGTYNIKYDIDDSGIDGIFGTADDKILYNSSNTSILTITTNNTLASASTIDSNNNGFIDQLKLTFSKNLSGTFNNSGLTIGTLTPTLNGTYNGKIAYLNFTDGVYTTGDTPNINDTDGNMFNTTSIISNFNTIDTAKPIAKSINGTNLPSGSININENAKFSLIFSENMLTNTLNNNFIIKENGVNITNNSYIKYNNNNGNTLYYCIGGYDTNNNCIGSFNVTKNYTIDILTGAQDWVGNNISLNNINININILDVTPPIGNSITHNLETNLGLIINGNTGNNNITTSSNGSVNLNISGSDNSLSIDKMCISNSILTNNSTCTNTWENYSNLKQLWALSINEGTKTVYIKFKDISGNISSVYTDTILWDKTGPTSSLNGGTYNNGVNIPITFNCTDTLSSCDKTYYTIDGTIPTSSSLFVLNGSGLTLTGGVNTTKTIKFFSVDSAGNNEGLSKTASFIFSNSYVTFSNTPNITSSGSLTLTGTCNNALGVNNTEINVNNTSYVGVTNDNCSASNTWSNTITLLTNINNNIKIRLQSNTGVTTQTNIINDTIAPVGNSFIINNLDTFTSSTGVILSISASDINSTSKMCISIDSTLTGDINCNSSSWETYATSKNYNLTSTNGLKTLYIKFRDIAGNISNVLSDSITLDSTIPILSNNTLSGIYNSSKTIILSSTGSNIYYTVDGTTPTTSSTLYSTGLIFGSIAETKVLKAISISNAGVSSNLSTNTYTFACNTVANGTISNYPTCNITCNSGYTLNGTTCIQVVVVSSGGGVSASSPTPVPTISHGGGGGGGRFYPRHKKSIIIKKETTNSGIIIKETIKIKLLNLNETKIKLNKALKNPTLKKLVDILAKKIHNKEIDFYISFDSKLKDKYLNIVKSYNNLLINLDKYLENKDKKLIPKIRESYKGYLKYKELTNFKLIYIDNKNKLYKTKYTKLEKPLNNFEKIFFNKIDRLKRFNKISEIEYNDIIKNYNNFVLYLTIYKQYKYKPAAKKALIYGKKFISYYK